MVKNPPANAGDRMDVVEKIPWRRAWPPISGFFSYLESPMDRGACRLQATASQSVRRDWSDVARTVKRITVFLHAEEEIINTPPPFCAFYSPDIVLRFVFIQFLFLNTLSLAFMRILQGFKQAEAELWSAMLRLALSNDLAEIDLDLDLWGSQTRVLIVQGSRSRR